MRGEADGPLLETLDSDLARQVTGLEPNERGEVILGKSAALATQRLAIGGHSGGIAVFTWPAELKPQAERLYRGQRGHRLLEAASAAGWEVEPRPHLAFWYAKPSERLYLDATIGPEQYVQQMTRGDLSRVGQHLPATLTSDLWPWLLARGYASRDDERYLEPFIERLRKRGDRPAHFRPGLRLLRRWSREDATQLRAGGALAAEIRTALNTILAAMGDPTLPKEVASASGG